MVEIQTDMIDTIEDMVEIPTDMIYTNISRKSIRDANIHDKYKD